MPPLVTDRDDEEGGEVESQGSEEREEIHVSSDTPAKGAMVFHH